MKTSIIDVPRKHTQEDLFGIKVYQDALIDFINDTETPITIALQGEWGSGKTSLMNLLRWNLCDKDGAKYFPVWINTWQFSLLKTPAQAIFSILEGCINQIGELNPEQKKWEDSKKKIGGIFKKMASVGAKVAASAVGVDGDVVDGIFEESADKSDIVQLKEEIQKLVDSALEHDKSKVGFTFYIDDLDRIDPPVAVEILELLKNIFDLDKCVFILAIDYDVVIKGLKSKFGELTDKNEREFRAFFDKIIQLPFSMPVSSYNVDTFLVDALSKIEFFSKEELNDEELGETLSEIARLSVGTNPRSLKRLSNTLSLISIINRRMREGGESAENQNKVVNFALVCTQIAYPYIYNQLSEAPDFKNWNEGIAAKLKLRKLTADEQESLDQSDEFNEEWEKVCYRMCQKETHLSNRAFHVSQLLNKIANIVDNDEKLGDVIEATIELSAVTNLKAFDAPKKIRKRGGRESWGETDSRFFKVLDEYLLKCKSSRSYEFSYTPGGAASFSKGGKPCRFVMFWKHKKYLTFWSGYLPVESAQNEKFQDKDFCEKYGIRLQDSGKGNIGCAAKAFPDSGEDFIEFLAWVTDTAENEFAKKSK